MKEVNDQLTNQVDRLKNESKELRNRLNVIETESKSTRPRSKAKQPFRQSRHYELVALPLLLPTRLLLTNMKNQRRN